MTPSRIFLDTNVFITGAALPETPEVKILRWTGFGMPQPGPVEVVVSQELFEHILRDVAASGIAEEQIKKAVGEAIQQGLVNGDKLLSMASRRGGRVLHLIRGILGSAAS